MNQGDVQTLVLRSPPGPAVAHLILTVPQDTSRRRRDALHVLRKLEPSFGPQSPTTGTCVSIGFSFAGLEGLGLPEGYLRLLRRLAPAFADGAVLRSVRLGDSGPSAAPGWRKEFQSERAHVVVSWHGPTDVHEEARQFALKWRIALTMPGHDSYKSSELGALIEGERLGAPDKKEGEWVHYGYRDGISEICIDKEEPRPSAPDQRPHEAGELLLGEVNGAGVSPFALAQAPEKVRSFFRHSSFGILRPMSQDVKAFNKQIDKWAARLSSAFETPVSRDFVKAKLCGRWPDGRQMLAGDTDGPSGGLKLDFDKDKEGLGCPFGSHLRRMRAAPDGDGHLFERPLQRRSVPYGHAAWNGVPEDDKHERGLLGHFFCANIEAQFEHLLGQWAARAPLGFEADDNAPDPVIGAHADKRATLLVPWKGRPPQRLSGFGAWTRTLGTMYAWYPGKAGFAALLKRDFERDKDKAPWL